MRDRQRAGSRFTGDESDIQIRDWIDATLFNFTWIASDTPISVRGGWQARSLSGAGARIEGLGRVVEVPKLR
jgi:hypothetical protein